GGYRGFRCSSAQSPLVSDSPNPLDSAIDLTDPVFCKPTQRLKQMLTEAYGQEPPVAADDDESPLVFDHGFWWLKDRIFIPPGLHPFILQSNVFCRNESIAATVTEETLLQAIQDNRNADAYDRTGQALTTAADDQTNTLAQS
ncbi:hypothetical protein MJO29_016094, partial [Puccinia striiformis f. sp. tritici]